MRRRIQNKADTLLDRVEPKAREGPLISGPGPRGSDVSNEQKPSDVILRGAERTPKGRTLRRHYDVVEKATDAVCSKRIRNDTGLGLASNPLFWNILPINLLKSIFYGNSANVKIRKSFICNILDTTGQKRIAAVMHTRVADNPLSRNILRVKYVFSIFCTDKPLLFSEKSFRINILRTSLGKLSASSQGEVRHAALFCVFPAIGS